MIDHAALHQLRSPIPIGQPTRQARQTGTSEARLRIRSMSCSWMTTPSHAASAAGRYDQRASVRFWKPPAAREAMECPRPVRPVPSMSYFAI